MNPLLDKKPKNLKMRFEEIRSGLKMLIEIGFISIIQATIGQLSKRRFKQTIQKGEKVLLDDLELYKSLAPDFLPQVTLDDSILRLKEGFERMGFASFPPILTSPRGEK